MILIFELSKEHNLLPEAEVLACFDALEVDYENILSLKGVLVLKTIELDDSFVISISRRLAMVHHVSKVLEMCESNEVDILRTAGKIEVVKDNASFAVRVSVNKGKFDTMQLERTIGSELYKKGGRVNLKNPDKLVRVVITSEVCIFGLLLHSIDRTQFVRRRPHLRPFFFPGVVLPKIARTMVNLSRIREQEILFDPFCGTGGILIEAGLVGARLICGDVQKRMVLGTKQNLCGYDIPSDFVLEDACNLALKDNSVDAVVVDPPYGRSARIMAESIEDLYKESMKEIHRVLKIDRRAVIASYTPLSEDIKQGFKTTEEYSLRVHKSLTRHIIVLIKVNDLKKD